MPHCGHLRRGSRGVSAGWEAVSHSPPLVGQGVPEADQIGVRGKPPLCPDRAPTPHPPRFAKHFTTRPCLPAARHPETRETRSPFRVPFSRRALPETIRKCPPVAH